MKTFVLVILFLVCLTCYPQLSTGSAKRVILPNPRLLRCVSSDCAQLWPDKAPDANDIYPKQVVVDLLGNNPCPLGVMARYDKSVSMEDLKAAIDERYGKWAAAHNDTSPVKLWRVETEKFAIQLTDVDKRDAKIRGEELGTKTIIYMAFQPPQSCSLPK